MRRVTWSIDRAVDFYAQQFGSRLEDARSMAMYLGGETPLETALSEGAEIGYEGFELGNKFPKDGPSLQAKLAEFGVACVSGWYSGFLAEDTVEAEVERCVAHMAKLQFNGAKVVVYGECAGTVQGQIDTYGIKLAYHHMGAYVESPADIDQLTALKKHLARGYAYAKKRSPPALYVPGGTRQQLPPAQT